MERHCANGIPEPTTPPTPQQLASYSAAEAAAESASATTASVSHDDGDDDHGHDHDVNSTATTCEPHGDHWHCPAGVAEPTTAPAQTVSRTASVTRSNAAGSTITSAVVAQQTGNVAATMGVGNFVALFGAAVYFL